MSKTSEQFKQEAFDHISKKLAIDKSQMFVTWYAKELQNHKALISFHGQHELGDYIEVTYNGDKGETYYDFYQKTLNEAVPDENTVDDGHGTVVIEFDNGSHSIDAINVDLEQLVNAATTIIESAAKETNSPKSKIILAVADMLEECDGE